MNRAFLSLAPMAAAFTALGQTPNVQPATPVHIVTESSKVSRFVAGPGGRLQGFLLRNGTFVILSAGLSQKLPSTISTGTSISVAGAEFSYDANRTIQAKRVSIAGNSYEDFPPANPAPPRPPTPPPAPLAAAPPAAPRPCPAPPVADAPAQPVPPTGAALAPPRNPAALRPQPPPPPAE